MPICPPYLVLLMHLARRLNDRDTYIYIRYKYIRNKYLTRIHTNQPGNPAADGRVLSSTAAGVRSWIPIATTDHGALTGLADDDHTQYYNQTRGDARYSLTSHTHLNYATLNVTTNSKTSAYTVVTGDNKIIECSGTFTVTLPDSLATGFQVTIVNVGNRYDYDCCIYYSIQ